VLAALRARDRRGGCGQIVDISLLEALTAVLGIYFVEYDQLGIVPKRQGNRTASAPRNTYRTKDGRWVAIAASTQSIAERLFTVMGCPEILEDSRFATNRDRVDNVEEIDRIVGDWVAHRPQEELVAILVEAEVAVAPVMNVADLVNDPQLAHRHTVVKVPDNELGEILMPDVQPKLSATPGAVRHPGPPLGHDTDEILRTRLGLDAAEIETLRTDKVV
jgi:crotonobetainyl-CoA:carnitine CoA-transferase CaiB-like acyl-CoA transferase